MKKQLLSFIAFLFLTFISHSQVISIVGSGVNGWPPDLNGPEITLSTSDNVTYRINNLPVTTGFVKFRQDFGWTVNWGASTFPNGQGTQDGSNIPSTAGTYDVTFNRLNGTYTFIGSSAFPVIGIWGPAVDAQNGYAGDDIEMQTTDGIIYTLGDFNFSSGQAYFRQDNNSMLTFGAVAFPTGTALSSGPSIFIPGGEYFVTYNRITGEYNFEFPRIGILGSALGGFGVADTDLITTNGFEYNISNLLVINGELKFRKNDSWTTNWGSTSFPTGTGVQNGPNIPIGGGAYNVTFDRSTGNYSFVNALSNIDFSLQTVTIAPNPSSSIWNIQSEQVIDSVLFVDVTGKVIQSFVQNQKSFSIDSSNLSEGIYFLKLSSGANSMVKKIIKN